MFPSCDENFIICRSMWQFAPSAESVILWRFLMIKSLQRRISTLFICLLTVIWLVILFLSSTIPTGIISVTCSRPSALPCTIRHGIPLLSQTARLLLLSLTISHTAFFHRWIQWNGNNVWYIFRRDRWLSLKQGKALISNHKNYVFSSGMLPSTTSAPKRTVLCLMLSGTPALKSTFRRSPSVLFWQFSESLYLPFLQGTLPLDGKTDWKYHLSEKNLFPMPVMSWKPHSPLLVPMPNFSLLK